MGLTMQAYISLRGEVWVYITWLTLPLVIEVSVPSHESEQSCICVLGVLMLFLSTILIFDFGIAQTVWYCILVLLRQCGILFWYCSDSVVSYFSLHYMVNRLADVYA